MISIAMQVALTMKRAYQRIWNDLSATAMSIATNIIMALIIGSVFYGTPDTTREQITWLSLIYGLATGGCCAKRPKKPAVTQFINFCSDLDL